MDKDFSRKVLEVVGQIPEGKVMTYSQVADKAGSPRAYRAVGSILNKNFRRRDWQLPLEEFDPVPCHRVIRSDGFIGGFAGGSEEKEKILAKEGHVVENHRIKMPSYVS
jgi:O-6-methylguanine DNA methyltransferase